MKLKFYQVVALFVALSSGSYAGEPGKVTREVWTDIEGSGLWHLENEERYHGPPALRELIDGIEPPSDWGESYGQRLRGYITAPETGRYIFWIAGDDNCRLSISDGESKSRARPIAFVGGMGFGHQRDWVEQHAWGKYPNQKSKPIVLHAGQRYFFEVLHKDLAGPDHLSVAWKRPRGEREVIPSDVLESFTLDPEDQDDDGLPDAWEQANGLSVTDDGQGSVENGSWGDPDGDGWRNWEECANGSDPQLAQGVEGAVTRELWRGIWGYEMTNLFGAYKFHGPSDEKDLIRGITTNAKDSDLVGVRLRGYIIAPSSGSYRFWLTGNDNCEFWMSPSSSKFARERLAWIERGPKDEDGTRDSGRADPEEWNKYESQRSGLVELVQGEKYFFEVLLKDEWWDGHAAVQWSLPGSDERGAIPSTALMSYVPTAEDRDGDELPRDWEIAHGFDPNSAEAENGGQGDPDRDLIPNWLEYEMEFSPTNPDSLPGAMNQEMWRDIDGYTIESLYANDRFYEEADSESLFLRSLSFGNGGERFGMRVRALLHPPTTGEYRFWIAGNENCELWISSDEGKFEKRRISYIKGPGNGGAGDWVPRSKYDVYPSQASGLVHLEEGKSYFIEVLLKEGDGDDHVSVAWQPPGSEEPKLMEGEFLSSFLSRVGDDDDDYLPDDWESEHGLNPEDNGRTDRTHEGERGDFDEDGLSNHQEYLLGTSPGLVDTDGDGVGDGDELAIYESDPLTVDVAPPTIVQALALGSYTSAVGSWELGEEGELRSTNRRGELSYDLILSADGHYLVEVQGEVLSESSRSMPLSIFVDGRLVAETQLAGSAGIKSQVRVMLPYLTAGTHQLVVDSNNVHVDSDLQIDGINILAHGGTDINQDGTPDWLESYFARRNSVTAGPGGSATSPVCLEGVATWAQDVQIAVHGATLEGLSGVNSGWYVDAPLAEGVATTIDLSYEGGVVTDQVEVTWTETNLFAEDPVVRIRKGDALRLTAYPTSENAAEFQFEFSIGDHNLSGEASAPVVYRFEEAGVFEVIGLTRSSAGSARFPPVRVEVVEADFGEILSVYSGQFRDWALPGIPAAASLDSDAILGASEWDSEEGARTLTVSLPDLSQGKAHVLARLGVDGPILGRGTVQGFLFAYSSLTGEHHSIERLPDGSVVVEVGFVLDGQIPPGFLLRLFMSVPDAVFLTGESHIELDADDFDENGIARATIVKGPTDGNLAVCHVFKVFDGEAQLNR